eukprot:15483797-Alexandrium_andersonii.AAC.1
MAEQADGPPTHPPSSLLVARCNHEFAKARATATSSSPERSITEPRTAPWSSGELQRAPKGSGG